MAYSDNQWYEQSYRTLFVRGFDWDTPLEALKDHMSQAGWVDGVSFAEKGRAFVTFRSPEEAAYAVETLHGSVIAGDTRYIECRINGEGFEFAPIARWGSAPAKRKEPPAPVPEEAPRKTLKEFEDSDATTMPRRMLTKEPVEGEVYEWADDAGWIKPYKGIIHPTATEQGGFVYVRVADVKDKQPLIEGTIVKMKIFSDCRCIGAAEVQMA
mmetsp:Transcript_110122/g.206451  ORF Transcript_110122/g.206451 Transcript_110122/m.206451 type:complete len:212 (+) Transcript_110122:61-696(+)